VAVAIAVFGIATHTGKIMDHLTSEYHQCNQPELQTQQHDPQLQEEFEQRLGFTNPDGNPAYHPPLIPTKNQKKSLQNTW